MKADKGNMFFPVLTKNITSSYDELCAISQNTSTYLKMFSKTRIHAGKFANGTGRYFICGINYNLISMPTSSDISLLIFILHFLTFIYIKQFVFFYIVARCLSLQ